jgi:Polysaccharide biosynthesis protein
VPLVLLGFGVRGALAGTALGTLAATALCIAMARHSYAFAFCWADVKKIVRLGGMVVVPVLCLYIVHSADIVLLSRFATAHELGVYRVASRFAVIPSYFASALLMAWAPLEHGVLFRATYKHVGEERVRGAMLSYYLLVATTIVVLLDVGANALVLLAGPEYRSAAPLIPLIGIAFVSYGLFIMLVRTLKVRRRMLCYSLGAALAAILQIGLSAVMIPWLGAYGAPVAVILGLLSACGLWIVLAIRAETSVSIETRPLLGLGAAFAVAASVQAVGLSLWPAGRPEVLVLVLASYIATLTAMKVIPKRHMEPLARLVRASLQGGLGGADPALGLQSLGAERHLLLTSIERDRVPVAMLAERLGRSEGEIEREYVSTLRELISATPEPGSGEGLDERIAGYLLSPEPDAQRDLLGHELIEQGVPALELMELDEAARRLRALPARAWTRSAPSAPGADHKLKLEAPAKQLASLP